MNSFNVLLIKNISVKLEKSADIFSKSDPYVRIFYGTTDQRTQTQINTNTASWNQRIIFPYIDSINSFKVKVYDEDKQTNDDFILEEQYQKYLFEMEELNLEPMSFEQFKAEAMMAEGEGDQGIASLV